MNVTPINLFVTREVDLSFGGKVRLSRDVI